LVAAATAVYVVVWCVVAGCSGQDGAVGAQDVASPPAATVSAGPTEPTEPADKPGGTLRLLVSEMPSADPGWADDPASRAILRLVSRQLYDYPAGTEPDETVTPVPDLAVGMPTVSEDGTEYTVRLGAAALWDTGNVRRVTATDVARGVKRLCTPPSPSPTRGYFAATVVGFTAFCDQLAATTPQAAAAFVEDNDIPGVEVVNDDTVTFHLVAPSADFVDVLALPAASPVPFEALAYQPDSRAYLDNVIALGPYRFTAVSGDEDFRMSRNPAWSAASDGIRPALPDHVTVTEGFEPVSAQAQVEAGSADLAVGMPVPAEQVPALRDGGDSRLVVPETGSTLLLAVGYHGPAAAALGDDEVRRALPYCIDHADVVSALGGRARARAATQFLQPGMAGYAPLDPFATPGGVGDPERCRDSLATAPAGAVTALTLLTSDSPVDLVAAGALTTGFARSGVRLDVRSVPAAEFAQQAVSPLAQSWDLALTSVTPAWYGNAGRSVFEPLLDERWVGIRPVDGGYRDAAVTTQFAAALGLFSLTEAQAAWGNLESEILGDAGLIPLAVTLTPGFHSANVRGFVQVPSLGGGDPTAVSLGLS
jgi:peptide/nickel transport system substrate-binding protein